MRLEDIKFRGIPVKAKEYDFIEGDLIRTAEGRYFIFPEGFELGLTNIVDGIAVYSGFGLLIEVRPETIGQFTGYYDANSKPIYEGDLIVSAIMKESPIYQVIWSRNSWKIKDTCEWDFSTEADPSENYIVVGNIYQNPELIGKIWYGSNKKTT
ncbi:MAG TPA: hypothetical protein DEP48_02935 [Persephonella sp.]|uniref:YopX protein n=1 Tax=Persephonella marina (strain DSM 14350 / EX-H1) TaxID=123214 RepID=C0QSA4_PERMH|nr:MULTISPECIES: YopX family protein [Persephonella]ACO04872.1 YopX protein [Persephonella marina EX-H1]HCB69293.1 hypothetical protein [Persephonella sp.]